jgi:hypothetical protein
VSPVALVPAVAVVSVVLAALAILGVAAVSPVLAMRWFSFVHEGGLVQQWNQTGCADSDTQGGGMSRSRTVQIQTS